MSFIVRRAKAEDLEQLYLLAKQFTLLNLPADQNVLEKKIEKSEKSFKGLLKKDDALYLFVAEDLENKRIVGSSQLVAKKGTVKNPCYSFKIIKKENFSRSLGIGFIHQVLKLTINKDGPTELGGLVVDRNYRNHPEKIGKLISLSRFHFLALNRERFESEIHAEMAPPLTYDGKSEFWESLGRRFTGLPYQEADSLSYQNKEFIEALFPQEEIYLCLLDAKARLVLGQVSEETVPALKILEKTGFKYKFEVDPFDGGPHIGAHFNDITIVQQSKELKIQKRTKEPFEGLALIAFQEGENFFSFLSSYNLGDAGDENKLILPESKRSLCSLQEGQKVLFYKIS